VEPNPRVTFRVVHEDAHLVVVDKPARVVTQPGVGHQHDTLLNGLFARYEALQQLGQARDFGLVHRLDKDTSGLVAVALTAAAYDKLREQFETRSVRKFYWAVCQKAPGEAEGVIRRPISEVTRRAGKYTATKTASLSNDGRAAVTAYRVLEASPIAALLEARPVTGRLHQVRVHLASIGAAILGDQLYGPKRVHDASARLALHAHRLCVTHPETGTELDLRSPMPQDLRRLLKRCELGVPEDGPTGRAPSGEAGHELGGEAVGDEEA
jgi:23S rRNA pseudouridine1911/1915/1917 synthase